MPTNSSSFLIAFLWSSTLIVVIPNFAADFKFCPMSSKKIVSLKLTPNWLHTSWKILGSGLF